MDARAVRAAVATASLILASAPPATGLTVTDVGPELGLPRATTSWDVAVGELDGDGAPDLAISYHSHVVFYRNTNPGLEVLFSFGEGVQRDDPHGCTIEDVDGDGSGDVYCTRGAAGGTIEKSNTLWMQRPSGAFDDRAAAYGVQDPFGRGRMATFIPIDHDGMPDLFVGNGFPRGNGLPSPNRTFMNLGARFQERELGLTLENAARCVQAVDQNRDGWKDLLVCGRRLFLYRNQSGGGFQEVGRGLGIGDGDIRSAWLADLNQDGRRDLTTVSEERIEVRPGIPGAAFGEPVYERDLRKGHWVAVGDLDGRHGLDILVVQTCARTSNLPDVLLVDRRGAWGYDRLRFPQARRGCGDVARAVDLNGDGRDEFVVLNGHGRLYQGPVQVLTSRWP